MEIVKKARSVAPKFRCVMPFYWGGKTLAIGEEIEIDSRPDQFGLCQRGMIAPCDLPPTGVYICLRAFSLPGRDAKFTASKYELVSLKAEDALPLMIAGTVIPRDDSQWRPANRHLKSKPDNIGKLERLAKEKEAKVAFETELNYPHRK